MKMSPAPRRKCGAMEVHERLSEEFPSYRANQLRIDDYTERSLRTGEAQRAMRRLITIPVVVHVVYKSNAENISKQQINTQMSVLNRDYRATNPDKSNVPAPWQSLVTDAKVEFKLATRDPKGKPTDGVTRSKTDRPSFGADDSVKKASQGGVAAWPTDRYLNIWVCSLGEGLLGYAQFPGGPAATDGVVILNTAFGTTGSARRPFNKGRTTTHEVGHFLNLRHIWGDRNDCSGNDLVADTPVAREANTGKPKFPHITCNNGPDGDMFMNYMDYVDDDAMVMFTIGLVARM